MKQVIFIGGASFSGTTFLNLMLANAPDAFSCGEVSAYFRPYKTKYLEADCTCGNPNCSIWPQLREGGESKLYENIFKMFPHINTIVDSSKDALWIKDMSRHLRQSGIKCTNLLIWKTPEEFGRSCEKRGRQADWWRKAWANYHRGYFRLVSDWISIKYSDIAQTPILLKALCVRLGISYNEGQERYWEKSHHSLFGNSSANIHLHPQDSSAYQNYEKEMKETWVNYNLEKIMHQKIFHEIVPGEFDKGDVTQRIRQILEAKDFRITNSESRKKEIQFQVQRLKAPKFRPMMQRVNNFAKIVAVRFKNQSLLPNRQPAKLYNEM